MFLSFRWHENLIGTVISVAKWTRVNIRQVLVLMNIGKVEFNILSFLFRLLGLVPTVMDGGRKLAVYMHREDTPTSDYSPVGIAMHLTCLADLYLAQGIDHTRLVLVIDMRTVRLGHLARYPLGLLRRFFLYAWVSRNTI